MTLSIELPDEVGSQLATLSPEERNAFAVAAITDAVLAAFPSEGPEFEESCEALSEAFADVDAGRTFSTEEAMARFAHIGRTTPA
jgi:predicted transcriptional regulator